MKLIGKLRKNICEDSKVIDEYLDLIATIESDNIGTYNVTLQRVYSDGSVGDDLLNGILAKTIASAKRRIIQDSEIKSCDFIWEEVIE